MPKVKIDFSLSFLLYLLFIVCIGKSAYMLNYLLVLFIHEYSHAVTAHKLGYKLSNIKLAPFGICLNINNNNISRADNIKIALAGPIVNIIMAVSCLALWWISPNIYFLTYGIYEASLVTAIFNLLPCYPLDGGRVMTSVLPQKINQKVFFTIINITFSLIFVLLFVCTFNLSLLIIALFIFLSIFTFNKAPKYDYLLQIESEPQIVRPIKEYAVREDLCLFKLFSYISGGYFGVFVVVDKSQNIIGKITESDLKDLSLIFLPTTTLGQIVLSNKKLSKI